MKINLNQQDATEVYMPTLMDFNQINLITSLILIIFKLTFSNPLLDFCEFFNSSNSVYKMLRIVLCVLQVF